MTFVNIDDEDAVCADCLCSGGSAALQLPLRGRCLLWRLPIERQIWEGLFCQADVIVDERKACTHAR